MKKTYLAIAVLVCLAAIVSVFYYIRQPAADLGPITFHHRVKSPVATSQSDLKGWKTYTNSQYGFSFMYPSNLSQYSNQHSLFTVQSTPKQLVFGEPFGVKGKEGVDYFTEGFQFNLAGFKNKQDFEQGLGDSTYNVAKLNIPGIEATRYDDTGGVTKGPVVAIVDKNSPNQYILFNYAAQCDDTSVCVTDGVDKLLNQILSTFKFAQPQASVDTSEWKTYTNSQYGFSFMYPNNWSKFETKNFIGFDSSETEKCQQISAECPHELAIFIEDNPANLTALNYYDSNTGTGVALFDSSNKGQQISVSGRVAYKVYPSEGIAPSVEIIIPYNGFFIRLETYGNETNLNKILSTFKFTQPQASVDTSEWKTYTNNKYGFELKYPTNWLIAGDSLDYGVFFQAPPQVPVLSLEVLIASSTAKDNALQDIKKNNCPGDQYNPGDHLINYSADRAQYALFCSATSEDYVQLIELARDNFLKLTYHDNFQESWPESKKLEILDQILSTFKFTN